MRPLLAAGLICLGSIGFASPIQDKGNETVFSLQWKPKVGETHTYHVTVKFDYGEATMQFASDLKVKVLAVNDDGSYTIQNSSSASSITSGTEVRELPPQPPTTEYYSKLGLPAKKSLENRDSDPFQDLLDHLTEFQAPFHSVKIRETWLNRPTGPKKSLFGEPRLAYTLVDVYRDGLRHFAKIRYVASLETDPEAATGSLVLDRANNYLMQADVQIPHFKTEETKEEAAVTVSLKEKV